MSKTVKAVNTKLKALIKAKQLELISDVANTLYKLRCDSHRGRRAEAMQRFENIKSSLTNYQLAFWYFELGDADQGFFYLEKVYEEKDLALEFITVLPSFDGIRNDSRYKDILRKMNLE